jgi:D-amino peptidase
MVAPMSIRGFRWFVVLAMMAVSSVSVAEVKIYIITDLEGASGVYKFSQTREPQSPRGQEAMAYLMGDIAAVVRGLRDAGATEILVVDGHDGGNNFISHLMEPGAKYVTGVPRPLSYGLDESVQGIVMVGYHAMMGTSDGVLNHTQSSKTENRYWYNGVESGEIAQEALIAGHYNVPPIMVTGDEAVCREARKFFGDGCVAVAVKRGISREAAVLYPFVETRKLLYEGAKQAVAAIPKCKPYKTTLPIKGKLQFLTFEEPGSKPKLVTKEREMPSALDILNF